MRRPVVFFLIFIIILAFFSINLDCKSKSIKDYKKIEIEGTVKNYERKEKYIKYYIDKTMVVSFKKVDNNIKIGDRVKVFGKEENLHNFFIKDFNYGRQLLSKGTERYIILDKINIVGKDKFYTALGGIKERAISINKYLYKEKSDLLNAILLGEKSGIEKETYDLFSDSGTSHILAISGLHITIICSILILLKGRVNSVSSFIVLSLVLILYNIMVGSGASTSRAVTLSIFSFFVFFIDKKIDKITTLSIIAITMIISNKYIVYNISFQLSFLAVLSLVVYTKYIKIFLYSDILASTLSANILTAPIVANVFKTFSIVGILGNIVAIPFIGVIIFLDIASIIIFFINLKFAIFIADINSSIFSLIIFALERIGDYGKNNIYFSGNIFKFVVVYYSIAFILALVLERYMINKNKFNI
ncbi:ComEC/Rec2 family competence protein [Peptostreptococcus faecalis]|uniref:ComEC/Rec2 family competence protein n=1 Tax=Peptostreptococcus faecalis TaxID=2045015 RepID=UPI0015E0EC4A|nr:ComEC/Rec2 family competence protein [Peptostreptococcus faecalis]